MLIFQCILLINLQVVFDISIVFFNLSQSCLSLNETKKPQNTLKHSKCISTDINLLPDSHSHSSTNFD